MDEIQNTLPFECPCGHKWREKYDLPMEMGAWLKQFRRMQCPACGAAMRKLKIPDSPTATVQERPKRRRSNH